MFIADCICKMGSVNAYPCTGLYVDVAHVALSYICMHGAETDISLTVI